VTTDLDIAVTKRYGRSLTNLRERLGIATGTAWLRLGSYDEADIERLAEAIQPVTDMARQQASLLTAGFLNHFTGTRLTAPDLVSLSADVWRPPFMTTWAGLARGDQWEDAVSAGHERSIGTAGEIVTSSARETATVIDEREPRITGWNRVPTGNCCAWCAQMAAIDWGSAWAASLGGQHRSCHCDLVPITEQSAPGRALNAPLQDAPDDSRYVTPDGDAAEAP
jgi:hypothetical protein